MNALPKATMTLDDLKLDYATASTEQQKALVCRQAWDLVLSGPHEKVEARDWLAKEFPDLGPYQHELRLIVLNNPNASVLWDRIDGPEKMLVGTACSLLRKARKQGKSLTEVLAEYDMLPWKHLADGTKFRCASAGRHSQKKVAPATLAAPRTKLSAAHAGWSKFRAFGEQFMNELLEGMVLTDADRAALQERLDVVMSQAQAEMKLAVKRLREHSNLVKGTREVASRSKVVAACRSLAIDPPKPGQPADLDQARKQKRRLARAFHPDTNDGVTDLGGYQTTLAAYDTLEEYNQTLNPRAS
jgi:hypothetical protein